MFMAKDKLYQCNFCKQNEKFNNGMLLQGKYFICDGCFGIYSILNEIEHDKENVTQEEIDLFLTATEPPKTQCCKFSTDSSHKNTVVKKEQKNKFFPTDVKFLLDKFVIGQDIAKKVIATAVYNHYLRLNNPNNIDIPKNNILLIGSTGVGKTYLVEVIAKLLDIPFVLEDGASLTQTGWKGNNVNTLLENLIMKADGDIEKAQKGIVYIDEIDKMGRGNTISDINGTGVQQCLLKMVEGVQTTVEINRQQVQIDTRNILFIGGGAFTGLTELVNKRFGKSEGAMGFGMPIGKKMEVDKSLLLNVKSEDIINFGFIPEFVGRFPTLAVLQDLNKDDLKRILTEPYNCLVQQYTNLFQASDIEIVFTEEIIDYIVDEAIKLGTGARSLKTVVEEVMRELMYELPSSGLKKYTIGLDNYKKVNKEFESTAKKKETKINDFTR